MSQKWWPLPSKICLNLIGIFNVKFQIQISNEKLTSKSQKFPNLLVAYHWLPTLGVAFGEEFASKQIAAKFEKKNGFFEVKLDFVDDFCFVTFKELGCYVMFLVIFSKSLGWPKNRLQNATETDHDEAEICGDGFLWAWVEFYLVEYVTLK